MAKTWSTTVGSYGFKVRVGERRVGGSVYASWFDPELGGSRKRSLGYPVRGPDAKLIKAAQKRAIREAEAISRAEVEDRIREERPPLTVGELCRKFRNGPMLEMGTKHRQETGREVELIERALGAGLPVRSIDVNNWDRLARDRASGAIDARGNPVLKEEDRVPVGQRAVQRTQGVLRQLIRYGLGLREDEEPLIVTDPTLGFSRKSNRHPNRPKLADPAFAAMLEAAPRVNEHMKPLLVLAEGTGRRIGSILRLRVEDWHPDAYRFGGIVWEGDADKLKRTTATPVTQEVAKVMSRLARLRDGWLFPADRAEGPVTTTLAGRWWRRCEKKAKIPHRAGVGWHSCRRRFANKLKGASISDVAALGGWAAKETLLRVYMGADDDSMEEALLDTEEKAISIGVAS